MSAGLKVPGRTYWSAGRGPRTVARLAVLLAAAILSFFCVTDSDVFWHLKTGQVILDTGRLVHTNLFSSTHPDYPWHNMEWLFQVLLALCYNTFGWEGVLLFKLVFVLATAALLLEILLKRAESPFCAAAITLFVVALMRFRFTERPQIVSFLLFAVLMWAIERRAAPGRMLWILPAIFALWSNIHPELLLGLIYLAATVAGDWIDSRRARPQPAGMPKRETIALALCVAATLANPEGLRIIGLIFEIASAPDPAVRILEFRRSALAEHPFFFVLMAVVAVFFVLRRESRTWSSILPLVVLGGVAVAYNRGISAFAMAAAPLVHEGLAAAVRSGEGPRRRWLFRSAAGAAAAAALLWAWFLDRNLSYRWGYGPDEDLFPAAAASFILANDLPPNLFHHYNLGGYLIFRLYPRVRVFQDGRGCYPPAFLRIFEHHDRESIRRLFDENRVSTALVGSEESGLLFPPSEWGVVFWDFNYTVLLRRTPANLSLLDALEYRAFQPEWPIPQGRAELLQTLKEMRRNQAERLQPDWLLAVLTGIVLRRLHDVAGSEVEMLRATLLAPREAEAWAHLAVARSILGKRSESAAAAAEARRLDPEAKKTRDILGQIR